MIGDFRGEVAGKDDFMGKQKHTFATNISFCKRMLEHQGLDCEAVWNELLAIGINEGRLLQLFRQYSYDVEMVRDVVTLFPAKEINNGYMISDNGGTGVECIERLDMVAAFDGDAEAAVQAKKDGVALIPEWELPEDFFLIWDAPLGVIIDTPENRDSLRKFCEQGNLNDKRNQVYEWIIGIGGSEWDGVDVVRVQGTVSQIRDDLYCRVDNDRLADEGEWDFGTSSASEVAVVSRDDDLLPAKLYAHGCYLDYHIDYTATRADRVESVDLTAESRKVAS